MSSLDVHGDVWLTVDDVARERGVDRTNAWRWLKAQELVARQEGLRVIERRGRRLYASGKILAILAAPEPAEEIAKLKEKVALLEEHRGEQDARINGLARELLEFRRQSREWFRKQEKAALVKR